MLQARIKISNPKPIFIIIIQTQCLSKASIQEMNVKVRAQNWSVDSSHQNETIVKLLLKPLKEKECEHPFPTAQ